VRDLKDLLVEPKSFVDRWAVANACNVALNNALIESGIYVNPFAVFFDRAVIILFPNVFHKKLASKLAVVSTGVRKLP
jgi:hypothetical protein